MLRGVHLRLIQCDMSEYSFAISSDDLPTCQALSLEAMRVSKELVEFTFSDLPSAQ